MRLSVRQGLMLVPVALLLACSSQAPLPEPEPIVVAPEAAVPIVVVTEPEPAPQPKYIPAEPLIIVELPKPPLGWSALAKAAKAGKTDAALRACRQLQGAKAVVPYTQAGEVICALLRKLEDVDAVEARLNDEKKVLKEQLEKTEQVVKRLRDLTLGS